MRVYTVHAPPARRERSGLDAYVFVRDGFHFWAFLLPPFWMALRRLWLVLVIYVVLSMALAYGLRWAGVPRNFILLVEFVLAVLIGLEAATLRRWTLRRRGWREAGVVSAPDRETAERRFFDAFTRADDPGFDSALPPAAAYAPPRRAVAEPGEVIGMFPQPGRGR